MSLVLLESPEWAQGYDDWPDKLVASVKKAKIALREKDTERAK